jgi:carboxymethylenebutenolidase
MTDVALPYFVAGPSGPGPGPGPGPGVVVIHEGNGISAQLLRVCQRLAAAGYATVAPDLFFRVGGSEAEDAVTLMASLSPEQTGADIERSFDVLRGMGASAVGVVGFCMGGLQAYRTAVSVRGCDAAVCFYGARIAGELGEPHCPTLLLFGAREEYIPLADIEAVAAHHAETVIYPEAGHGFMRDRSDCYDEEAAGDGWRRMLAFLADHLGAEAPQGRG